jgi:3-hydroxyacyl-CoA dehydrogenase
MRLVDIENITVLGIGVMGPDISLGLALAGYRVRGVDVEPAAVDRAQNKLKSNLQQMVQEGFISRTEAQRTRSRITFTLS